MRYVSIYVYASETHELIGIFQSYFSLRIVRRYDKHGEIEIRATAAKAAQLLQPGVVLWVGDDLDAFVITAIEIAYEDGRGDVLTATGPSVSGLLSRRALTESRVYTGTTGSVVNQLAGGILGQARRGFNRLSTSFSAALGSSIEYESELQALDDAILDLIQADGLGIQGSFDVAARTITLSLYKGVDRTAGSATPVIFSPQYQNIDNIRYVNSLDPYKNIVYVAGMPPAEDGEARMMERVGDDSLASYARYEAVTQADKSRTVTEDGESRTLTDEEYAEVLKQHGTSYLGGTAPSVSCDGTIVTGNPLVVYGVDYFLGDLVTYRNAQYGIMKAVRIAEEEHAFEGGRYKLSLTLGTELPTLKDKIKRL